MILKVIKLEKKKQSLSLDREERVFFKVPDFHSLEQCTSNTTCENLGQNFITSFLS